MQQVTIFLSGERNYSLLEGDTGPIVCVKLWFHWLWQGGVADANALDLLGILQGFFISILCCTISPTKERTLGSLSTSLPKFTSSRWLWSLCFTSAVGVYVQPPLLAQHDPNIPLFDLQVPPYALIFLTLSKRLHSIFVLRLFNDGVAMMFFYAAVLFWTNPKPRWSIGSIFFR